MYFNLNAIETLLINKDPQEVADDFAKTLNQAIQNKKKKEQELAAKKAREIKKAKIADTKTLEESILVYLKKYYPKVVESITPISDEDIQTLIETFDELYKNFSSFIKATINIDEKNIDAIQKFLEENKLI